MIVRTVYALKRFATLDEAQGHVRKIKNGASKHRDCDLEIHYDEKAKAQQSLARPTGMGALAMKLPPPEEDEDDTGKQWSVVVVDESLPPGSKACAECDEAHFQDDYLCPNCRAELG